MLAGPGSTVIDQAGIRRFMKNMGHQVKNDEVDAVIRRLDIDGDKLVKYSEFVESLSPVCPDPRMPRQRETHIVSTSKKRTSPLRKPDSFDC